MFHELSPLLPNELGPLAIAAAAGAALIGLFLWLMGARFSRSILALNAVALGAVVGLDLPNHFRLPIGAWASAVVAALSLGLCAYIFHRVWAAMALGLLLGLMAAVGAWILCRNHAEWTWPTADLHAGVREYLRALWDNLPTDVRRVLPVACATAAVSGLAIGILWPRAGAAMLYSLLGGGIAILAAVMVMTCKWPALLSRIPGSSGQQGAAITGFVLVGALVQWRFARAPKPPLPKSPPQRDD